MIRPILFALAALTAAPASPAMAAGGQGETRSLAVPVADLDLSTAAGRRELERRVERAVSRICGPDRRCRDEAWASAWDQANAAIARDEWMRRLAAEREAQLRACGRWAGPYGCPPPGQAPVWQSPVWQGPAYPPPPAVTVIVIGPGYYPPAPMPPPGYYPPLPIPQPGYGPGW
ncbi:UrcA family protein [Sphingomonas canadensis]|uniref:UrcA family protein n=1 Tax=Sphingomonas canadensis TaxID=1219257 RepID=A0ABW3H694_9SPHN|nr:UrcA family protein [Sphingomonas canadensis]MCW3836400.1 UrcA family protein [Sphingomonas canadensis]